MYYKFLHSKDVHKILEEETLLLGSLSYYRGLEDRQRWIGDSGEGLVRATASNLQLSKDKNDFKERITPLLQDLPLFTLNFDGEGVITEMNIKISCPDYFVFSFSKGFLPNLHKSMCLDAAEPYDACLHISSIIMLCELLYSFGQIEKMDCNFRDMFPNCYRRSVLYENTNQNLDEPNPLKIYAPQGHIKDDFFKPQSEMRIICHPGPKVFDDKQIIVKVPGIKEILKLINLPPKIFG